MGSGVHNIFQSNRKIFKLIIVLKRFESITKATLRGNLKRRPRHMVQNIESSGNMPVLQLCRDFVSQLQVWLMCIFREYENLENLICDTIE